MKESMQKFWSSASDDEKSALIVLVGIWIFVSGIAVGRAISALL